jgi:Ferritin-like domain
MTEVVRRRTFVAGLGAAGAGIVLGACSGSAGSAGSAYTGDFRLIALAAALENQAIGGYRALLAALRAGRLGDPAPALVSLAETCLRQHAEHAARWNAILRSGHRAAISGVPLAGHTSVLRAIGSAGTALEAVGLAIDLESRAEQTYVAAVGHLDNPAAVAAAASIAPVEAMHVASLRFLAGEDPTPSGFAGTAAAVSPRDLLV